MLTDDEIRRAPRVTCDIILNKVESGHMHICRASNISIGGMRIQKLLEPLLGSDEVVRLQFELPGEPDALWVHARKVYDDGEFIGLSFTNVSQKNFSRLRQWLRSAANTDTSGEMMAISV
jgi:hypothetical protein